MLPVLRCVICFYPVAWNELAGIQCGHTFHSCCIAKWLRTQKFCPTCRTVVTLIFPVQPLFAAITERDTLIWNCLASDLKKSHSNGSKEIQKSDGKADNETSGSDLRLFWYSRQLHIFESARLFRIEIMHCHICSSYIVLSHIAALPCGHTFHFHCISRWIEDHQTCPICPRRTTKESIIKRLFFTPSANVGSDVKDEDAAEVSNAETDEDANSTDNDDEELSEDGEGNGQ